VLLGASWSCDGVGMPLASQKMIFCPAWTRNGYTYASHAKGIAELFVSSDLGLVLQRAVLRPTTCFFCLIFVKAMWAATTPCEFPMTT